MAEVARTSRGQLTNANLQSAIAEALDLVLAEFSAEEVGRWMPQISVWLWSDSRGEHGYTPLHNATEQGALEAVMWLISKGRIALPEMTGIGRLWTLQSGWAKRNWLRRLAEWRHDRA